MTRSSAVFLTSTVLACAGALDVEPLRAQRSPRASESRTRQVYVSVVDRAGKPVTGLTTADFKVREDGNVREVLSAAPATDQMTIAIGVDDSQSAQPYIQFIRDGLNNFVKRLDGKAQIAVTTFGERPTVLVDYTDSAVALQKGITRIFSRSSAGAYLLEALVELSQGMQRRQESPRKAIVILTVEAGPEFSNLYSRNVIDAIKKGGATLHVLALGSPTSADTDELRNRNMAIADGTALTGGRRDQVLAESGIGDRLLQLADELTNQYVVSYSRPESLIPPERLDVTLNKPGPTVRAPKQAPGK